MSFYTKTLWDYFIEEKLHFDCILSIENENDTFIILSSLEGGLFVFKEKSDLEVELLTQQKLKQPILKISKGKLISALKHDILAILHPQQLSLSYIENDKLESAWKIDLNEPSYSMTVSGRKIFVTSMFSQISFFEREARVFETKIEETAILPAEIAYLSKSDLVVTASQSSRILAGYSVPKWSILKSHMYLFSKTRNF